VFRISKLGCPELFERACILPDLAEIFLASFAELQGGQFSQQHDAL